MSEPRPGAELALLLDVGTAWAKASVIGRVAGRWRVIAHASQPTAWGSDELRRALVERLEAVGDPRLAGHWDRLLSDARRIECHTARRPGRLALAAVSRELSGSAARRAAEAAGWKVVSVVTLDDGRLLADRLATLESAEVDAWLLVGGFDEGATPRAVEVAAMVAATRRPGSAPVVWAGTRQMTDEVVAMFEAGAVSVVPNPRPTARADASHALREHLRGLWRELAGDGDDEASLGPVALPRAVGMLAVMGGLDIMAVDVGASSSLLVTGHAAGTTSLLVSADGGLAGVTGLPGAAGRVARTTDAAGDEAATADMLQALRAHPATLPEQPDELAVTQAAARLQLAALVEDMQPAQLDLLIGCGLTIAAAPTAAQAAGILLDGVRPLGVTQLAIDPASLLGPLGSLTEDDELREGMALVGDDLLVPLGTAIVCRGAQAGHIAMRVTVDRTGWPTAPPTIVRAGQLQVLPLGRGVEAEVTVELGPGVNLGNSRRVDRVVTSVTGGTVGLILDARGVPIAMPRRAADRRAVIAGWSEALERGTERPV